MKLRNIRAVGRFARPDDGKPVNVKKGNQVGRSNDRYFWMLKGVRQWIDEADFRNNWKRKGEGVEAESQNALEFDAPSHFLENRTEREIVDACNELARMFYKGHGYDVPEDYKMYDATHPQELGMWNLAVMAYDHIEGTDVEDCLNQLRDDEDE